MIAQCPRCGSARQGDGVFCQSCGFDFSTSQAPVEADAQTPATTENVVTPSGSSEPASFGQPSPFSQPAPAQPVTPQPLYAAPQPLYAAPQPPYGTPQPPDFAPQPVTPQPPYSAPQPPYGTPQPPYGAPQPAYGLPQQPASCPRCHAPLYPGYPLCGNCGLDLRSVFATPPMAPFAAPTATAARKSSMPMLVVIAGVVALVAAGGLFYVSQQKTPGSTPRPSHSLVAVATPSGTDTLVPTPTPAETLAGTRTSAATPEPAPTGTWTKYTSADQKWSVKFPGTSAPLKQTMTASGTAAMNMTFYYTMDSGGAVYAVYVVSGTALNSMDASAMLDYMKTYMTTYLGSSTAETVVSTTDITIAGKPGVEMELQGSSMNMTLDLVPVGSTFYMLLVGGAPGTDVYPHYFVGSFTTK